jgi:hypothetical protein
MLIPNCASPEATRWRSAELAEARDLGRAPAPCVGNHTQRSAFSTWRAVAPHPHPPQPLCAWGHGSRQFLIGSAMKTARFVGHHEEREALVLSVAGVTAIMLIANLLLLILY